MEGKIKRIVKDKGFGFIEGPDRVDRFFHRSALDKAILFDNLNEGDRVTFEEEPNPKGPRACRIALA